MTIATDNKINNMLPFIDLASQQTRIHTQVSAAIQKVLAHGQYIMGPEVFELEEKLSASTGSKHVISCSNGTDALVLALMAKHIKNPNDAIFVPSFTFAATAESVAFVNATPVFVDVETDNFNLSPDSLKTAILAAKKQGLTPKGIIAVDLFGHPADYTEINLIAQENNLFVISDGAQSCGSNYHDKYLQELAEITTTSFFPAKPLGCYGDGGAVFTDDDEIASHIKNLRIHGFNQEQAGYTCIGMNGRLDSIQAAILLEKLAIYPGELKKRDECAHYYSSQLNTLEGLITPAVKLGCRSSWAQYTLRHEKRDEICAQLKQAGIPTAIHYTKPLHKQIAYQRFQLDGVDLSVSENLAKTVFSLPMHAYLTNEIQDRIVGALKTICRK